MLKDGYLIFASSPEVVRRFGNRPPGQGVRRGAAATAVGTGAVRLPDRCRDALLPVVAEKNNLSKDEAARRLDGLTAGLRLLDRVEVSQSSEAGKVSLTLRLQTAEPLK